MSYYKINCLLIRLSVMSVGDICCKLNL